MSAVWKMFITERSNCPMVEKAGVLGSKFFFTDYILIGF